LSLYYYRMSKKIVFDDFLPICPSSCQGVTPYAPVVYRSGTGMLYQKMSYKEDGVRKTTLGIYNDIGLLNIKIVKGKTVWRRTVYVYLRKIFDFLNGSKDSFMFYNRWRMQRPTQGLMSKEEKCSRVNPFWLTNQCRECFRFVVGLYITKKIKIPHEIVVIILDFCY